MKFKFYLIKTSLCAAAFTTSYGMENDPNFNRQGMKRASPDALYEQDIHEPLTKKARTYEETTPIQFLASEELKKVLNGCYENNFFDPFNYSKLNWGEIQKKALLNFKYAHLFIQHGPNQGASDIATLIMNATRIDYNPAGQYVLGYMYWNGKGGVGPNLSKAIKKFTKAANSRYLLAARALRRLYFFEKDTHKELKWLKFAAKRGDLESMIDLADRYADGKLGIDKINNKKAIEIYTKGAHMGDPYCAEELGALYQYGCAEDKDPDEGFEPDISESLRWFLQSLALENRFYKKPRGTTCVDEVNQMLIYNASVLTASLSQLINFRTFKNLYTDLSDLEKIIRIYKDFINFNTLQSLNLLHVQSLNDIFVSFLKKVPYWKEILTHLQKPQPNLLLTCLTPRERGIEQELIERSSKGLSAYNHKDKFYLNVDEEAALLSLKIMNALGLGEKETLSAKKRLQMEHSKKNDALPEIILRDLGYDSELNTFTSQILNYQKEIDDFIEIFKSSISIPYENKRTEEIVNLINEIKETLKNYIEYNACERNEGFIKNHPQLATRGNEPCNEPREGKEDSVNDEESL